MNGTQLLPVDVVLPIRAFNWSQTLRIGGGVQYTLTAELSDLASHGVRIPPTELVVVGDQAEIRFVYLDCDREQEVTGWHYAAHADSAHLLGGKFVRILIIND